MSEILFLIWIAMLPIMRPVVVEFSRYQIPIADFVFLAAAVAAARGVVSGRLLLPRSPVRFWLTAYAAALACSTLLSADRRVSALKLAGDMYLIAAAMLALIHVRTLAVFRRALIAWMAGTLVTVAAAGAGLALFAGGLRDPHDNSMLSIKGSLPEGSYPRVMGLFLNPNMYCAYLAASLGLLVVMQQQQWITRRTARVFGAVIVLAAVASLSPGFGGILLVIGYVVWQRWCDVRPLAARTAAGVSMVGAIAFLAAIVASPAAGAPMAFGTLRASSRLLTWMGSANAFRAHPLFGKGLGLPVVNIGYINPSGIYELLTDAHNTWLSIAVQCGVVGLVAFVGLNVVLLVRASRTLLQTSLTVAWVAGFLYQSLSGSFENTRHVWALIGLIGAARDLPATHTSRGPVNSGPPAATYPPLRPAAEAAIQNE
jgi:O-antigen ligase